MKNYIQESINNEVIIIPRKIINRAKKGKRILDGDMGVIRVSRRTKRLPSNNFKMFVTSLHNEDKADIGVYPDKITVSPYYTDKIYYTYVANTNGVICYKYDERNYGVDVTPIFYPIDFNSLI